ncbi:Uba4p [Sugiyamaella lignohabitans]|uniref:Uba4p n=1 Tax=Sugiyamaella lignohabitans TaxID=796027 RepID=A0A161HII4_9ASCO|nr:Uba4p [Sugiyamaella lignohabitans]ANB12317.1 Uba4p [Sugiyamaella lignohabitans]
MASDSDRELEELRKEVERLRIENASLKRQNFGDDKADTIGFSEITENRSESGSRGSGDVDNTKLELDEYLRYGRQLIVPEIGLRGQLRLKKAKILVVGAGGLGSSALAYLAGAGVGTIGIVDDDTVESSNLQRQIIHNTPRVDWPKCHSAAKFIRDLNPKVNTVTYKTRLTGDNAFDIFTGYDLVLDCTDTPSTRYLINDTAVLLNIPLVSASALKTEGQLLVLNYLSGPCYRCLFPIPPPPDSVLSCGDGGILGPVVGIMGVLQSIEAIKVITGAYEFSKYTPSMTLFSAYSAPQWRYIRMRGKKDTCAVCGSNPSITRQGIEFGEYSYEEFCGRASQVYLKPEERVTVETYSKERDMPHTLIDVRESSQFDICSLPGSISKLVMLPPAAGASPQTPLLLSLRSSRNVGSWYWDTNAV